MNIIRNAGNLTDEDIASFARLGISPGLLALAGVERVTDSEAREKFGFVFDGDLSGLVFPCVINRRRVTARLRRDHPEVVDGKIENKYISAFGDRRHLYLPPDYELLLNDVRVPLLFVESEKAVLAITEWARRVDRKVLPIGCGGCWGWRGVVGVKTTSNGSREEEKDALPEVAFAKEDRTSGILFDANVSTNPKVTGAREAFRRQLEKQGAKALTLNLPAIEDVNGPDDFIAVAGDQAFGDVLDGKYKAPGGTPDASEPEEVPGRLPVTDISNAERLNRRFHGDICFASDRRIWCAWNGTHWRVNDQMGLSRRMQEVARDIYLEAANEANEERRKALSGHARRSESQSVQVNSIDAARCHMEIEKFSEVFDTDPLAFNAAGATICLNGEPGTYPSVYAHRREDYLTKVAPVEFDREAKCPGFDNFLAETFRGSAPLIEYVRLLVGYFLTGLTIEQKWWMFYGPTASGKSTFVNILHGLLGPYALALPENYFLVSRNTTDFVTAKLTGMRLATCVETNDGRRLDVARIKTMTGEDTISAALKYQNYFEFKPQCKLVLVTNYAPDVPAGDDALWRRLKVVPFTATVPEEKRISGLAEKLLEEEAPGILNWALTGCRDWQLHGLKEPPEVTAAIAQYRSSEDIVASFLADCYEQIDGTRSSSKEVFADFRTWCDENSVRQLAKTKFTRELHRLGIALDDGRRFYLDIEKRSPFEPK